MIATTKQRYTERSNTRGRVDRESGVIHDVKFLGPRSRDGRRYTPEAMRRAVSKYEGKKIFVDHPDRDKLGSDRSFHDWIAVARDTYYREGEGIFGSIHCLTKSPHYEGFFEAVEKFGGCFGMSHVADGEGRMENGEEIVESIDEVFSIDVVTDPATTAGIFESTQVNTHYEFASFRQPPTADDVQRFAARYR